MLRISKNDLMDALDSSGYEIGYFLDRESGDLIFATVDEPGENGMSIEELRENAERFLEIEGLPGRVEFGWMADFTDTLRSTIGQKLYGRLQRPKPFAGFKDLAAKLGVIDDWYKYRDQKAEQYAMAYAESLELVVTE